MEEGKNVLGTTEKTGKKFCFEKKSAWIGGKSHNFPQIIITETPGFNFAENQNQNETQKDPR